MAPLVSVKFDERKLRSLEKQFKRFPKDVPKIMSRSINKTAVSTRADAARKISAEVAVNISTVKKRIVKTRATFTKFLAELSISRRRIRLIDFKAKVKRGRKKKGQVQGKPAGVTYKIDRTGSRKLVKQAFIGKIRFGKDRSGVTTGVLARKGKGRLPVIQLQGPSLGILFQRSASMVRTVTEQSAKTLEKFIDQQVKLILEKR